MNGQDARREMDRRTLLAGGAKVLAVLATGCAWAASGVTANGLRQLRFRLERHVEPGFAPGVVGLVRDRQPRKGRHQPLAALRVGVHDDAPLVDEGREQKGWRQNVMKV
jgi:hypothetical protein